MAVRTSYPATESVGDVLRAADVNKLPGGWIGYAEITANQTGITTETNVTSLSVTVTVNTSRRIQISCKAEMSSDTLGDTMQIAIKESATMLNRAIAQCFGSGLALTLNTRAVVTPSAGSHTYNITAARASGSGNTLVAASSTSPAWILVEDIGPSS